MVAADYHQILGVNNCRDLAEADKIMKKRMRNISWLFDILQTILNKNYNGVTKVDNDFILKQFGEIEHKVSNLIENCKAQAAANSELKNKLNSLEEEIQGKVEAEKNYAEEKALIRSKIDGLLARLDDISEL